MEPRNPLFIVPRLCIFFAIAANSLLPSNAVEFQERFEIQSADQFKNLIKTDEFKAAIPDFIGRPEVNTLLAQEDYTGPPAEVIGKITDAVMPILSEGLALIPGVPLIGGVVTKVWDLFSPFLESPENQIPMAQLIEDFKLQLDNIKSQVKQLGQKIPQKTMDDKFRSVVDRAIRAGNHHNGYICSKYALLSKGFSDYLKQNKPIEESLRMEMIADIANCDNFLQETAEAFIYPEFADVLWVPNVIRTFVRAAFLAEISNYGVLLKLDERILRMFWFELAKDIQLSFGMAAEGAYMRLSTFLGKNEDERNFTALEYEGCRLQRQLLYFNRKVYPYGIPYQFCIANDNAELFLEGSNIAGNDEPHHIQVYNHAKDSETNTAVATILNCIMGPDSIITIPNNGMSFRVNYVPNKLYEVRLLYFTPYEWSHKDGLKDELLTEKSPNPSSDRRVDVYKQNGNDLRITLGYGAPNENSAQRFLLKASYQPMTCKSGVDSCFSSIAAIKGTYVVENVAAFNILSSEESKGKIVVENLNPDVTLDTIWGLELVVLPIKNKPK